MVLVLVLVLVVLVVVVVVGSGKDTYQTVRHSWFCYAGFVTCCGVFLSCRGLCLLLRATWIAEWSSEALS